MTAITAILRSPDTPSAAMVLAALTGAVKDIAEAHGRPCVVDGERDVPENIRRLMLVMARNAFESSVWPHERNIAEFLNTLILGRNLSERGHGYDDADAEKLRTLADQAKDELVAITQGWIDTADNIEDPA